MIWEPFWAACGLLGGGALGFALAIPLSRDLLRRQGERIEELEAENARFRLRVAELIDQMEGN